MKTAAALSRLQNFIGNAKAAGRGSAYRQVTNENRRQYLSLSLFGCERSRESMIAPAICRAASEMVGVYRV